MLSARNYFAHFGFVVFSPSMAKKVLHNIGKLLLIDDQNRLVKRGSEMNSFPILEQAWLTVEDGRIIDFGEGEAPAGGTRHDLQGAMVWPTYVDSHTHLIFAGTREDEFAQRLAGLSYEEIARRGGGIINSALKLRQTSEDALFQSASARLDELIRMGTGAIEVKSGYGLDLESELKMLRVIQRLKEHFPIPIKATFLGAHALPPEFKENKSAYLDLIIKEMLPVIQKEKLADYIDAFCEKGYFNKAETERLVAAGADRGLRAKIHTNQFNSLGALPALEALGTLSVDHLEVMTDEELNLMGQSTMIATALPGCSLFLEIPYTPGRALIDRNAILALASDYNPGSAPSGNMNLMVALACIKMKLTPEEALSAATLNGAAALELSKEVGSIAKGKKANFIVGKAMEAPSFIPYNFGHSPVKEVWINGQPYA